MEKVSNNFYYLNIFVHALITLQLRENFIDEYFFFINSICLTATRLITLRVIALIAMAT